MNRTEYIPERNAGLRRFLGTAWVYQAFQSLVISRRARQWIVSDHIRPAAGMIVVDVGCGPARLRTQLPPDLEYFGFDPNPDYIKTARRTANGTFSVGTIKDFIQANGKALAGRVDLVTCMGVLHHVSSESMDEILTAARCLLRPGGRFVAIEPVFLACQDAASRWVLRQDRGTSILNDVEWRELLDRHFPRAQVRVTTHLLRIPYTHALLTGWAD